MPLKPAADKAHAARLLAPPPASAGKNMFKAEARPPLAGKDSVETWLSEVLGVEKAKVRGVVEAHLKAKRVSRNEAETKFKEDIRMMATYCAFIVLYSISAASVASLQSLNVRGQIQPQLLSSMATVQELSDIYTFLNSSIIPAVTQGGMFAISGNVMMTPVR